MTFYGWPHADVFVARQGGGFPAGDPPRLGQERLGARPLHPRPARNRLPAREGKAADPEAGISDVIAWDRHSDPRRPQPEAGRRVDPLILYVRALRTILDPFMGSGSTLLAARDFGLDAIGIDCEIRWCRYAASRLSQAFAVSAGTC